MKTHQGTLQGTLYIVATPIGNLQDMTPRAVQTLSSVDLIAAEDTRHSRKLTQHFSIDTPLTPLHDHNERHCSEDLLEKLAQGQNIALISDAGTPLISDPGYFFVHEARQRNIDVVPIPGACAVVAALSISGLPTDRFVFEGFLPAKSQGRLQRLHSVQSETRTLVYYESPHRILACLNDMKTVFGEERQIVLARELTKTYETVLSSSISAVLEHLDTNPTQIKGEMVVLVSGAPVIEVEAHEDASLLHLLDCLLEELPLKQAVSLAVKITGHKKNSIYKLAVDRRA